ncbi:MAG: hypothetical protein RSG77_21755 [Hafnia sp.]
MRLQTFVLSAYAAAFCLTAALVTIKVTGIDQEYYFDGMLRDSSIKTLLSPEELQALKDANPNAVAYQYGQGDESHPIDLDNSDRLQIRIAIECQGAGNACGMKTAFTTFTSDNEPGDGFAFRVLNGELHTFSSGKIRDDASRYREQITKAVHSTVEFHKWLKQQ